MGAGRGCLRKVDRLPLICCHQLWESCWGSMVQVHVCHFETQADGQKTGHNRPGLLSLGHGYAVYQMLPGCLDLRGPPVAHAYIMHAHACLQVTFIDIHHLSKVSTQLEACQKACPGSLLACIWRVAC